MYVRAENPLWHVCPKKWLMLDKSMYSRYDHVPREVDCWNIFFGNRYPTFPSPPTPTRTHARPRGGGFGISISATLNADNAAATAVAAAGAAAADNAVCASLRPICMILPCCRLGDARDPVSEIVEALEGVPDGELPHTRAAVAQYLKKRASTRKIAGPEKKKIRHDLAEKCKRTWDDERHLFTLPKGH